MDHNEAVRVITEYCGKPLLESLEELYESDLDFIEPNVVKAYHQLMNGFRKLFNGGV